MDRGMHTALGDKSTALVIISFLQADCRSSVLTSELRSLRKDLTLSWDAQTDTGSDDGDIECDGFSTSSISAAPGGIRPSVELDRHDNQADIAAIQEVALGLRVISDQFHREAVAQATQNLQRSVTNCPTGQWRDHLSREVKSAMTQGVGLENHPQERVIVALSLALVKGVCERAPQLLRSLFTTALEYISSLQRS